jgi:LmbE family N-acetylglucosaminyl deacetylase
MKPSAFHAKTIDKHYPLDLKPYAHRPGNVLVIAPHPDDDVIGAGGTMALLAQAGKQVFSLYMSDGSNFPGASEWGTHGAIKARRQKEALAALETIQAQGGIFLKGNSRKLKGTGSGSIECALREVICFLLPESIYAPAPFELHPTHDAVLHITLRALRSIRDYIPQFWGYTVWGGIFLTTGFKIVDISSVAGLKARAIRAHKSQIAYNAYDEGILGRNRYEAVFSEPHMPAPYEYVERFLDMQELVANKKLSLASFTKRLLKSGITSLR